MGAFLMALFIATILTLVGCTQYRHERSKYSYKNIPLNTPALLIFKEAQEHCGKIKNNTADISITPQGEGSHGMSELRTLITCSTITELGDARLLQFYYGERDGRPHLIRSTLQTTIIDELRRNQR